MNINLTTSTSTTFAIGDSFSTTGSITITDGTTLTSSPITYTPTTYTTFPSILSFPQTNMQVGDFTFEYDEKEKALKFIDQNGKVCFAVKDGALMLGTQTIYEVIVDVVQMMMDKKNVLAWAIDEDPHRREIAKTIHKKKRSQRKG